jgi:N-acetylglucosamine-6-phosphate deacetylase
VTTALTSARLHAAGSARWLAIDGELIVETGDSHAPSDAEDLGDALLVPGFIDLQINGIADIDFSRCAVADVARARERLLSHGVTTFLPTLISAPMDSYATALDVLEAAAVDGVHLEGPFLGGAPGAHRREYLKIGDVTWMADLLRSHRDVVKYVTLAPEADPGFVVTRMLRDEGVVVSVGHSTACYDDVLAAAGAGA